MKIRFSLLMVIVLFLGMITMAVSAAPKVTVADKDKVILQEKLDKFITKGNHSTGALLFAIGIDFAGTPYVAKTLDLRTEECLVVNLREFDCTTFVENCLALALTIKSGKPTYETFISTLEKIRYRNGHLTDYTSRLHYFSEWITDNADRGIVTDVTLKLGGINYPLSLNFMGTHPNFYPQLKETPSLITKIRIIEKQVSGKQFYFIPKEMVEGCGKDMMDGDIVAMTTKIAGLDVSHLGLIHKKGNVVFLLNASSLGGKVETTPVSLATYLKNSKNTTGIFVVRAN